MFTKLCPNCNKEQSYKTKGALKLSIQKKSICRSCNCIKHNLKMIQEGNHPFIGKNMTTAETIQKTKATKIKNNSYKSYKTEEFKQKMSFVTRGDKNPMFNKTIFDTWVEKYGTEEAFIRKNNWLEKISISSKGKNNPMYGKPTPKKAGNGWSGWYNQQFFRSLRELSYIINVLEKYNLQWQSAENIRIPYINYDGNERTYSPDYLINNNKLVEIKPKRLHNTPLVKLKKEAAEKYCLENKLIYELIDVEIINIETLKELVINNKVTLTEKTKEKLEKFLHNLS